jgi:O-antigen/teichoic acid export membrane protein
MHKFEKRQIIKNVTSSWFALGTNILVGLFLSPFILHRLGDSAFGVWVLTFSITGYYGLFDLGIRSSIVRYVSKHLATGSKEDLAKLINTALFGYGCVGVVSLVVTAVMATYVNSLFKIPPQFHSIAHLLIWMVGVSVALGFPLGVVGGFLEGLQRFEVLNLSTVIQTLLRAALIVLSLRHGMGLLMITFITVALPILASIVRVFIALHLCPVLFGWKYIDRSTFRTIVHYSSTTFMIMVAGRLKFKTDELVIGSMISAAAITYFNIGARIVDYAGGVVNSLAGNFLPVVSASEATGNTGRLRRLFVAGNRLCAFTIFPITASLLILGKSVIEVWVGKKYIVTSYPVLVIMIIPSTIMFAQAVSGRVLFGMSKHRTWGWVTLIEGVSNLGLSIFLVPYYGIIGDALGTAIPLTCSFVLFMPRHLCHLLGIRLRTYLREAFVLPLLIVTPMVAVLLLMKKWFIPHNYRQLALQLAIGGTVYGVGLLWLYSTKRILKTGELAANPEADLLEKKNGKKKMSDPEVSVAEYSDR